MPKRWLSAPAMLVATALVASACAGLPFGGGAAPGTTVKIVSSLPMTGPSLAQTQTVVNAITMAFEEIDYQIGNVTIEYEALDDATPAKQAWDAAKEAENARTAISDPGVVAYIGTYNSGAAAVSIPILCEAGLGMISPANTYAGLTKAGKGEADEPDKYYPGDCTRNYVRVIPADDIQGAAGASWAKELGFTKVFITHDNELYGKGLADVFRAAAGDIGLEEAGYEAAIKADNFRALANKVAQSGADLLYYGGIEDNNPHLLWRDVRSAVPNIKFMGPDGVATQNFMANVGSAGEDAYITFGGVPPSEYSGEQKAWLDKYLEKYGGTPDVYAIYGYEAAKVVIEALSKAGAQATDRAVVRDNIRSTRDFQGVLGTWSFNEEGDTTLSTMAGMQIKSGELAFVKLIGTE